MPEPSWVRVRKPGVGTWSQREDAPLVEGAVVLDGEPALDPAGRAIPDVPEQPDAALESAPPSPAVGEHGEQTGEAVGAGDITETPAGGDAEATGTRRR